MKTILNLINLYFKLCLRNKRARSLLILNLFFLLQFSFSPVYDSAIYDIVVRPLISIAPALLFGQLLFSWDSSYYPFIKIKFFPFKYYILANYIFITSIMLINSMFIAIIEHNKGVVISDILLQLITYIIVSPVIIVFFGTFNSKRIELNTGPFMNYEGFSFENILMGTSTIILASLPQWVKYYPTLSHSFGFFSSVYIILWILITYLALRSIINKSKNRLYYYYCN